jgi:hypothetical protein
LSMCDQEAIKVHFSPCHIFEARVNRRSTRKLG